VWRVKPKKENRPAPKRQGSRDVWRVVCRAWKVENKERNPRRGTPFEFCVPAPTQIGGLFTTVTPDVRLYPYFLISRAPVSFPFRVACFSTAPSRFLSSFPRKLPWKSAAGVLGRAQNQPKRGKIPGYFAVYLENPGYTWKNPVFCRFPRFRLSDFAPDQPNVTGPSGPSATKAGSPESS